LNAWNKASYNKINKGIRKDAWKRLLKTITLLNSFKTRTVIRLTVIKNINDSETAIKEFAKIIDKGQPDFLEIKSYMHLGYSRLRLNRENMLTHNEIKEFGKKLEKYCKCIKFEDEAIASRIILYKNNGKYRKKKVPNRWLIKTEK